MSNGIQYQIQVTSNATAAFTTVVEGAKRATASTQTFTRNIRDCFSQIATVNQSLEAFRNLKSAIDDAIAPGAKLNASMLDLQAITGVTGSKLKEIEAAARANAKVFGNDAAQSVESYKLILSKLDPAIAQNSQALKMMGDNVGYLSKTMNGNSVAATKALTTSMNQFGVSSKDPILAAKISAEMMNIMAAAAKEGSAEIPQITAALEQSGMMAKTANISFAELNSGIQILDKAGKQGSEGGIAIRNIIADISQGAYMQKGAREVLEQSGISVGKLSDKNLSLSQRMRLLSPIVNDAAKMTAVFGKENVAAAIALVNGADAMDGMTGKIVRTNTAVDQAGIVMSGYEEKMKRGKAVIDDWKIGIFNATQSYLPFIQNTLSSIEEVGKFASGINTLTVLYQSKASVAVRDFTSSLWAQIRGMTASDIKTKVSAGIQAISTGVTWLHVKAVNAWRNATLQVVAANEALSASIQGIPGFGWIVAAVAAISGAVIYLWETSRGFRETLFGLWEAAKAVFSNIGTIVMQVWELVIKPVFGAIKTVAVAAFSGIWVSVKTVFGWIVDIFKWHFNVAVMIWKGIYETIVAVVGFIWTAIVSVGNVIADFFGGIWVAIGSIFKGVGQFINEWLIQPIKSAFGGLWNTITEMFNKIMEKMKALFAPIVAIWNKIFSKNGLTDVGAAYEEGKKKGGESFDKDQADKKKQEASGGAASPVAGLSALQSSGISLAGTAMGAKAASGAKEKAGKESGSVAGGTKTTTVNLTIQKLIGIETLKTTNIQAAASQAGEHVVNLVLEALQGVNGKLSMD